MINWNEISNREKILLIILGVAAISISFYIFLYKPKSDAVADINNDLEQTVSSIKQNQDVLRRKEELKRAYKEKLVKLEKNDQDQAIKIGQKSDLVVKINELIDETGVNLNTMESIKNYKTESQKYGYTKMPIRIQVSGDYNNMLNFVNKIEKLKYLIKVDTLNLNSNLEAGIANNNESEAEINVQIKLVAFATDDVQGR
ncbi:type 4a pilus biogenesis protein PilO [Halanaerobacter jeridensis]|uniref:Tfp pilus assembly protein PilO n=1 Tax=Halanaerobacter jeridensis TaxID=706427 RepID=A0A939BQ69_9FIRM|nr:type 4a pilus biogenesis protein PilO [Halanaerobacter jeridensis]MBM7557947.1 Tfp pilus assembly protein PilO [Halanaerobacter jeridensis]